MSHHIREDHDNFDKEMNIKIFIEKCNDFCLMICKKLLYI